MRKKIPVAVAVLGVWLLLVAGCSSGSNEAKTDAGPDAAIVADVPATEDLGRLDEVAGGEDASDLTASDTSADEVSVPPLPPAVQAVVDQFDTERGAFGVPGASLALVIDGEVVYLGGSGTRKPGKDDPVAGTTLFRFGSILKMMTSTALLQQLEQGKVTLDDTLVQHLPDFTLKKTPDEVPDILVRNLLNHTSGMYDFLAVDTPDQQHKPEMLHDYMLGPFQFNSWFMSPPGRMYNYSNPNFMLTGLLVEIFSGEFYRDYMEQHVWEPLGMMRTTLYVDDVLADGDYAVAIGPDPVTGEPVELAPDAYDNVWGAPAGFGWTSAEELAKFALFLMQGNDSVLADETRAMLVEERFNTEEAVDLSWYGLGIGVAEGLGSDDPTKYYPVTVWRHSGGINGFASFMLILPDYDFALVTLASGDGAYFPETVRLATTTLVELPAAEPVPFAPDGPEQLANYVGDYLDPFNIGSIKVFMEGSELHVSLPDLDALDIPYEPVLIQGMPQNFIFNVQGFPLPATFILDESGQGEYFRTRVAVGKRVEIPDGQAMKQPLKLDRDRLLRALALAARDPRPNLLR